MYSFILCLVLMSSVSVHGHSFYYSTLNEILQCGSAFTEDSGSFSSPDYPADYPRNVECIWPIRVSRGHKVVLNISDIDIEHSSNCTYDGVEVYDGESLGDNRVLQLCDEGGNSSVIVMSSGRDMLVRFYSDKTEQRRGFTADFRADICINQKILKKGGDEDYFRFLDIPKTKFPEKVLAGSEKEYTGKAKENITFHVEGKGLDKFKLHEAVLNVKFVKTVQFTFVYKRRKDNGKDNTRKGSKLKGISNSTSLNKADAKDSSIETAELIVINDSSVWTNVKVAHKKKIIKLIIQLRWDSSLKKRTEKKIKAKELQVDACLD